MNAMESTPTFDVDALRAGTERRDASMMSDLYAEDARLTIMDQRDQPSRPRLIGGKAAIGEFLEEVCGRDMEHRVEQVVVSADGTHAAYQEGCRYPDGTRVKTTSMLDLRDGKIVSQTTLQAWDEPQPATTPGRAAARRLVEHLDFSHPDEVREFGHGRAEILHAAGGVVGRFTLEPGWRWSQDVKPLAGTEWCEAPHFQYQVSGKVHVRMIDGSEFDTVAGDVTVLPSGHDAWVVGDETAVFVDWQGAVAYAKKA